MQREDGLLLDRFHGDRGECVVAGGFQQRLGIGAIGLVAVAVPGDVCRVQELHLVARAERRPAPVMRRAAGLQQHLGGRLCGEKAREGGA